MLHIAIEGMAGVGKSTACELLARKIGFLAIKKPMHMLLDEEGCKVCYAVTHDKEEEIKALYFGAGHIYVSNLRKAHNIVTDRYIASNYAWNYKPENVFLFDYLVKKCGIPDYTFVLYAEPKIRGLRLMQRGKKDFRYDASVKNDKEHHLLIDCLNRYNMPFSVIDTSNLKESEVVELMVQSLKERQIVDAGQSTNL